MKGLITTHQQKMLKSSRLTISAFVIIFSKPFLFWSAKFLTRSVWLQPQFRDKDLEIRRKEFMRTLIKNPTKLLIIVERSKGERSIPEMDKVLNQSSTPATHFRKRNCCLKLFDELAGEVVSSSHDDSDGVGQAAQAEAQGGSPH